ncbi:MAG: hypothetical protein RR895_09020, partial [Hydrogenoanaerobacterium sp.]
GFLLLYGRSPFTQPCPLLQFAYCHVLHLLCSLLNGSVSFAWFSEFSEFAEFSENSEFSEFSEFSEPALIFA